MDIFAEAKFLKIVFFSVAAAALIALIVFSAFMAVKSKKRSDMEKSFLKKLHETQRNDLLNKAIANYTKQKNRIYWIIKVVEINKFGSTDHFFNLSDSNVSMGRDFKSNTFCIFDEETDLAQCRVELNKEVPCFVCISDKIETTFAVKKKCKRQIDKKHSMHKDESIRLFSGDRASFGETTLEFYVYNSSMGLV